MKTNFKRILASALVVCMLFGLMPTMTVQAAETEFENSQLSVVTNKESTLATGVTLDSYTIYDKNGDQVKMFVTTADMNVDTVEVFASYKDMNPEVYDMSKLTEQVASFNEKAAAGDEYYQGTVVAGINASYYNMTTGKPNGAFVMNGIDVTTESEGNTYGYFAVMKDGSVKIGNKGDYSSDKGNIQEAISIQKMLIVNGEICSGLNTSTKYPRQTIGITADNKVILMTADGNQAPTSVGLTEEEQAQVMLDLGCVWAGHLDGGGSCTYGSKPEGSDEFVITNSPSDGSERSISNGFIIVSTEAQSKEFNKLLMTVDNEYLTPGTAIDVAEKGVSSSGNAANIPEGITYETENCSYIDGKLTAGTETGKATITANYNGKAVGTLSVNVVNPDKLAFNSSIITIPYNKTVNLDITAIYGINEVVIKSEDIKFELSDNAVGTIDGFAFTSCEENETVTGAVLTATLNANAEVTCEATINLGKGSEVLQDFETGVLPESYTIGTGYPQYGPKGSAKDENGNYYYNGQNELGAIEIVSAENGKVHDGEYALAVECDFTQPYETGYHLLSLRGLNLTVPANAQTIGMWLYVPELEELSTTSMRFYGKTESGTTVSSPWLWDNCEPYGWDNDGWRYVTMDLSGYSEAITFSVIQMYICDRDNADVNFYFKEHASVNSKFTYYMDSITVDYSSAVADREAPVFGDIYYADTTMADAAVLNGNEVTNNNLSFNVKVQDNTEKTNCTGIDAATAKAFIDGVEVDAKYANGTISVQNEILADGTHTVRFEVCDNMGNLAYAEEQITVKAESDIPTISIVPQDADAANILIGSLYWVDLVSNDIQNVENAKVTFNLNSVSQWELDHMVVAAGFEAGYTVDEVTNNATITVSKVGAISADSNVLVQIPIRTWESRLTEYEGYEDQTPAKLWSRKIIWPMDIKLSVDYGLVKFADGTEASFSMEPVEVITELYGNYSEMNANGNYSDRTSWHIHTAEAMDDVEATCTSDGYKGRTFCKVCNSVVDWGTTIEATGHSFEVEDDVLKCEKDDCTELYNGVYTDGKLYADGIAVNGWINDSYYVDGVVLTGVQYADGYYYDFGEDGISKGKYTGLVAIDEEYYFSKLGELSSGWFQIGDDWYYFDEDTLTTVTEKTFTYEYGHQATYQFYENGKIVSGVWVELDLGTRYYYGPAYYKLTAKRGNAYWVTIDGNTYAFDGMGFRHEGMSFVVESNNPQQLMVFSEDGVFQNIYNGMYEGKYYENGYICPNKGLIEYEGDYYYIISGGKTYVGTLFVTEAKANGLVTAKKYTFGDDGKMVIEPAKNGIIDGKYYVDDKVVTGAGMVEVDGDLYFVTLSGKVYTNGTLAVVESKTNGLVKAGKYTFGADGKMVIEPAKNGIVDGKYYVNDEVVKGAGMVEVDGDLYFVTLSGKVYTNGTLAVVESKTNGLVKAGKYTFGADGKMVIEPAKNGIIDGKYYVNDEVVKGAGVVEVDGDFYFVTASGKVYVGTIGIGEAKTNGLIDAGSYKTDASGKLIIE